MKWCWPVSAGKEEEEEVVLGAVKLSELNREEEVRFWLERRDRKKERGRRRGEGRDVRREEVVYERGRWREQSSGGSHARGAKPRTSLGRM